MVLCDYGVGKESHNEALSRSAMRRRLNRRRQCIERLNSKNDELQQQVLDLPDSASGLRDPAEELEKKEKRILLADRHRPCVDGVGLRKLVCLRHYRPCVGRPLTGRLLRDAKTSLSHSFPVLARRRRAKTGKEWYVFGRRVVANQSGFHRHEVGGELKFRTLTVRRNAAWREFQKNNRP